MAVEHTLERALGAAGTPEEAAEARAWLARTESFLEWVARHPALVQVNCEAAHLLIRYRGAGQR